MQEIKISLPWSWWDDILCRGVDESGRHRIWERIAENVGNKNARGQIWLMVDESDLLEIIDDCYFYTLGHYDADLEEPYKYMLKQARAKLAKLKG